MTLALILTLQVSLPLQAAFAQTGPTRLNPKCEGKIQLKPGRDGYALWIGGKERAKGLQEDSPAFASFMKACADAASAEYGKILPVAPDEDPVEKRKQAERFNQLSEREKVVAREYEKYGKRREIDQKAQQVQKLLRTRIGCEQGTLVLTPKGTGYGMSYRGSYAPKSFKPTAQEQKTFENELRSYCAWIFDGGSGSEAGSGAQKRQ